MVCDERRIASYQPAHSIREVSQSATSPSGNSERTSHRNLTRTHETTCRGNFLAAGIRGPIPTLSHSEKLQARKGSAGPLRALRARRAPFAAKPQTRLVQPWGTIKSIDLLRPGGAGAPFSVGYFTYSLPCVNHTTRCRPCGIMSVTCLYTCCRVCKSWRDVLRVTCL